MTVTVKDLHPAIFESTVTQPGIVAVDWWASWCGPCMRFGPIFAAAAERHTDIAFAKVDTEAHQDLMLQAGISSIPTLMVFRDGVLVFREAGALPAEALDQVLQAVRDLDMDQVREAITASAQQQASPQSAQEHDATTTTTGHHE